MAEHGVAITSPSRNANAKPVSGGRRVVLKLWLICGILSSLLYVAMNVVLPIQWEGYNLAARVVSELSAIGAPTRPLWVPLGIAYVVLVTAFGWGVRASAGGNRPLRVVGALMLAYGAIGLAPWPPMHQREALAAGGGTLTDTLHIVWSIVTVLLMMLAIAFGAAAFGLGAHQHRRFPALGRGAGDQPVARPRYRSRDRSPGRAGAMNGDEPCRRFGTNGASATPESRRDS